MTRISRPVCKSIYSFLAHIAIVFVDIIRINTCMMQYNTYMYTI